MSGVLVRHRTLSELEFYNTARELRVEVNRIVMDEEVFPKRYRFSNAMPMVETARSIVHNIMRAERFYPNTPANVRERRRYIGLATADCDQLKQDLQCYIEVRRSRENGSIPFDIGKLERLIETADREIALLSGYRKRVRLIGVPDIGERIAEARAEVERLEEERSERTLACDVK